VLGQFYRKLRAVQADGQLSMSHFVILSYLAKDAAKTAVELASLEHVRPQSMAASLDTLEAEGLIVRAKDPGDRRRLIISISARGKAALAAVKASKVAWLNKAIATRLSAKERGTLHQAVLLMERLVDD
jgi:DNA-binding MarR family transcriptional regulator